MISQGMDVEAVGDLAREMRTQAAELERVRSAVHAIIGRAAGAWEGPDQARFRAVWTGSLHKIVAELGDGLETLAATLESNAEAQRRASSVSATGAVIAGAPPAAVDGPPEPPASGSARHLSPTTTAGFLDQDHAGDTAQGDGLRIQSGIGADGRRKIIVSIAGTQGSDQGTLSWFDNIGAVAGSSDMAACIRGTLSGLVAEDADFMFVGYSQGGMVAEELARSGDYGDALVITEAAPPLSGPVGGTDVLRLNAEGLMNGAIAGPGDIMDLSGRLFDGDAYRDSTGVDRLVMADRSAVDTAVRGYALLGIGDHLDHDLYRSAADKFDSSDAPVDRYLQGRIGAFTGIALDYDSDMRTLQEWPGLTPARLPEF